MITAILLDYHNTILPNKNDLNNLISKINCDSFYPSFFRERSGVIICIDSQEFKVMDSSPDEQKLNLMNSLNILSYASIIYSEKKGLIILGKIEGSLYSSKTLSKFERSLYLSKILEAILTYLPNTDWIFTIPFDDKICIAQGFNYPIMATTTPFGDKLSSKTLIMFRKNEIITKKVNVNKVYDKLIFVKQPGTTCKFLFRICPYAQKFLQKLSTQAGVTLNKDKTITQKEVSGGFKIVNTKEFKNLPVFILGLDSSLMSYDQEEEAKIVNSLYNFHTHPKKAYINHQVKFGWPSANDYSAYLLSVRENNTIFHLVASIEGIYIISLNDYWAIHFDELDVQYKFISDNYDLRKETNNLKLYLKIINQIKYGDYPIFKVQFSNWNSSKIFEVCYPHWNGNCFYSEKTLSLYQKFYA
jgi:hypothetical protein